MFVKIAERGFQNLVFGAVRVELVVLHEASFLVSVVVLDLTREHPLALEHTLVGLNGLVIAL